MQVGHGPQAAELRDLQRLAEVGPQVLAPGYTSEISEELQWRISAAAAELLGLDADALGAWLLLGEDVLAIAEYLAWLSTQAVCTACKGWFDASGSNCSAADAS